MHQDNYYAVPLLASRYDADTEGRSDLTFYLALARELSPSAVADIGAGTGLFCSLLARAELTRGNNARVKPDVGHGAGTAGRSLKITGVEPQQTMLDVARRQPLADRIDWVHGTAGDLTEAAYDLVFMTGHVSQYFLDDAAWEEVLQQISRALVPGGHLAFEARNAAAQGWRQWNDDGPRAVTGGTLRRTTTMTGDLATHIDEWTLEDRTFTTRETLRFPDDAAILRGVEAAGLVIDRLWGGWDGSSATPLSAERIVLARKLYEARAKGRADGGRLRS